LLSNPAIFLFEIWESRESAVLNLPLVVPVADIAVAVIVVTTVEWGDLAEIVTNWSDVITHDIYHHPNIHGVSSSNQSLESISISEVAVDLVPVSSPVPVITSIKVVNYW